jgi:hypothetical protein
MAHGETASAQIARWSDARLVSASCIQHLQPLRQREPIHPRYRTARIKRRPREVHIKACRQLLQPVICGPLIEIPSNNSAGTVGGRSTDRVKLHDPIATP